MTRGYFHARPAGSGNGFLSNGTWLDWWNPFPSSLCPPRYFFIVSAICLSRSRSKINQQAASVYKVRTNLRISERIKETKRSASHYRRERPICGEGRKNFVFQGKEIEWISSSTNFNASERLANTIPQSEITRSSNRRSADFAVRRFLRRNRDVKWPTGTDASQWREGTARGQLTKQLKGTWRFLWGRCLTTVRPI